MMAFPLTLSTLLERARQVFASVEIVSRRPDRSIVRTTYSELYRRSRALAEGLQRVGLRRGDRVATLMWNHATHLEAYFGIPAAGGVLHTLNLRLHPDELAYIVNHAEDRFLIVDDVLLPLLDKVRDKVNFERVWVTSFSGAQLPQNVESYEALLLEAKGGFANPSLDENEAAAMCYTSGTTGKPKGVVYSHRAMVLHSFAMALPDACAMSYNDTVLQVSSMFHANGWGFPYTATMVGAKLVFPGPNVDGESLLDLICAEGVTLANGVPTVWIGVHDALEKNPGRWNLQAPLRVLSAGSAVPESLMRNLDPHGIRVFQGWGMTETTPLATMSHLAPEERKQPADAQFQIRTRQGRPMPFVELRAMSQGREVPWDGISLGELHIRGPWIAADYHNFPEARDRWTEDGWFRTGDVVSIYPNGCIRIADRAKDLIKSGGEWISSVDLENALMSHPAVQEAAVVGVPHPKWQERPLAVVVCRNGAQVGAGELREFLAAKFAKWQLPDAIVFAQEIPRTSVGKFLKSRLREQFADWKWEP
ncbi:MAG: long-chain fatty acid--CoA ligase [Acidobacteria bacterium]|nr:long-chain fatty acid--CoA ligase [Acidobacteriota bacterium]MCL5288261.1 long-chain fatty acid--CoA ligase [Acidobacteriota bacterium]